MSVKAVVITVSDRVFKNEYEDESGPLAASRLQEAGYEVGEVQVVPDSIDMIRSMINEVVSDGARLVVTSGGTGVAPRDVTPEATEPKLKVQLPHLIGAIVAKGLEKSPHAAITRGLAGVTNAGPGGVLIVNAPGSPSGVSDAIDVIAPVAKHIIDQLDGGDHVR
ncbi:MAG: MogA/MoaB family molybdenum cofactor biosynthesis protein [Actinomycetaceae bacterium]|nr:MogA/MoaB family molybdenum cofactor biosynthesis protein [Actinomycetaceae bacterium]